MKGLITKEFADKHVIDPLSHDFKVKLVGSIATKGSSFNDIDVPMFYNNSNSDEIQRFENALLALGWTKALNQVNYDKNSKGDIWTMKVKDSDHAIFDVCLEIYFQQQLSEEVND